MVYILFFFKDSLPLTSLRVLNFIFVLEHKEKIIEKERGLIAKRIVKAPVEVLKG